MKIFGNALLLFVFVLVGSALGQNSQSVNENGKMLYEQHCLACHQADGSGVPGLAPPLIKGVFVGGEEKQLVNILLKGLEGVEIKGEYYANPMPAFDYLSDEDIASLLTYVRSNFSNEGKAITAEDVKQIREGK